MSERTPNSSSPAALLAYGAAALFTCASAGTNVMYGWTKGTDLPSSFVWAGVSLGVSIVFALSWAAFVRCLDNRQWPRAALVFLALLLTGAYSTSAALGSAMGGRVNAAAQEKSTADERKKAQAAYDAASGELGALASARPHAELAALIAAAEADLAGMPAARTPAQLQALIDGVRLNPQSADCATINGSLRMHCPKLNEWKSELVRAQQRQKLSHTLTDLRTELARSEKRLSLRADMEAATAKLEGLRPAAVANSDALALATYFEAVGLPIDTDRLNKLLVLLAVLVIECGGGLALLVGMSLSPPPDASTPNVDFGSTALAASSTATTAPSITVAQPAIPIAPAIVSRAAQSQERFLQYLAQRGGQITAAQRALAEAIGVSKTQITRLLGELSVAGRIEVAPCRTGTQIRLLKH